MVDHDKQVKQEQKLIDAATVLIVRDRPQGMEVFMVVRHHQIDFASGALVFPGGKVDPGDRDPLLREYCVGAEGLDDKQLAFKIAAIRESYEECGVLLARNKGSHAYITAEELLKLDPWREKFNKGSATMLEFAQAANLEFALDELGHYAHWITPDMMPKRFDTHFYLARAPEDHLAIHDGSESVDSVWIRPDDAIAEADAGTKTIIFPTLLNVQMLATRTDVVDAFGKCGAVKTVEPFVQKNAEGKPELCIQPDAGYGDIREPMERMK